MKKTGIGVVGCGDISGIYLTNLTTRFANTEVVGVCDLIDERAENAVKKYGIPKKYKDMHQLFADPQVEIVLNLTRPYEHHGVSMAAIAAGKHVYSEKPLGITLQEGIEIRDAAAKKGVFVGGAPDTWLGAGAQTCRKLIEDGFIGDIVAATAFFGCPGHESWHPNPEFYYAHGGGPVLDMGPYYVTALVSLLGPVASVSGMTKKTYPTRMITSEAKRGSIMNVEIDTHATANLRFENGAIATMIQSFDIQAQNLPIMEIYGTKGTISAPDPNFFGGPIRLHRKEQQEFLTMPLTFGYSENNRGLGLADMARAIETGRKARAGIDLYFHVLEVMLGIAESSKQKKEIEIKSTVEMAPPMPTELLAGVLD